MVDTIHEKIYWFHVTKEWLQQSNYSINKGSVRIELQNDKCFDREDRNYLNFWEQIILDNRRQKDILQQMIEAQQGKRILSMNLLDNEWNPVVTNMRMSVVKNEKNENGSHEFILTNNYELEAILLRITLFISADQSQSIKIQMSPMNRGNAFNNLLSLSCLAKLKKSEKIYLADNYSDFWASGAISIKEDEDQLEKAIEFYKTIVELEQQFDVKLLLAQAEIATEEIGNLNELKSISDHGILDITGAKEKISFSYTLNKNQEKPFNQAFSTTLKVSSERYWDIDLGGKIIVSSKPFIESVNLDTITVKPDPQAKLTLIFKIFFETEADIQAKIKEFIEPS